MLVEKVEEGINQSKNDRTVSNGTIKNMIEKWSLIN